MTFGTGGAAGQEGTSGGGCNDTPSMPGTQTAGGAGGGACAPIGAGSDGSFGNGGNGGALPGNDNGGGGGGAFGAGAGGSSFVASAGSNVTTSLTGSEPQVTISYTPAAATNLSVRAAPSSIVANGLTNAGIAARLVLSTGIAESHLFRAMRKLGISGRRELPRGQHDNAGATHSVGPAFRTPRRRWPKPHPERIAPVQTARYRQIASASMAAYRCRRS
jgi:DNA-binding CsgD family transcriptional regulator